MIRALGSVELPPRERLEPLLQQCLRVHSDRPEDPVHGVGVDVVDLVRLEELVVRSGRRFSERWFSEPELSECAQTGDKTLEIALRFAAKEAIWKALRISRWSGPVPWSMISVLRVSDAGETRVGLTGVVAEQSHVLGVRRIRTAYAPLGSVGVAVAVAMR